MLCRSSAFARRAAPARRLPSPFTSRHSSSASSVPATAATGSDLAAPPHADVCSGAPAHLRSRTVRIFRPAPTTTQSSPSQALAPYSMEFASLPDSSSRWVNPLMGWASSGDVMQGLSATQLKFRTREEAVYFAEKQGWGYQVDDGWVAAGGASEEKRIGRKEYAQNFKYVPGKIKLVRTK